MAFDRFTNIISGPFKRSFSRAFGRDADVRRASDTVAAPSKPIPSLAVGKGSRDQYAWLNATRAGPRPSTSNGIPDSERKTDQKRLLVPLVTDHIAIAEPDTAPSTPHYDAHVQSPSAVSPTTTPLAPSRECGAEQVEEQSQILAVRRNGIEYTAVLLDQDMLFQIQSALRNMEVNAKFESWAKRKRAMNVDLQSKIEVEMKEQTRLLSSLQDQSGSVFAAEISRLSDKVQRLETMQHRAERDMRIVESNMENRFTNSYDLQLGILEMLVDAGLPTTSLLDDERNSDDEEIPIEEVDFEDEYGYAVQDMVHEAEVDLDGLEDPEILHDEMKNAYLDALQDLATAQRDFDSKDDLEEDEDKGMQERFFESGEQPEEDEDDFSTRHLARKMVITRNLIVAEQALEAVKAAALEAGLNLDSHAESDEDSHQEDRENEDVATMKNFDDIVLGHDGNVMGWMEELPEDCQVFHDAESLVSNQSVSQWPARYPAEIEMWESGTDIACDWRADEIFKWHRICGVAVRDRAGRALSI